MNENTSLKVEESSAVANISSGVNIKGLEEVPANIIPVPFYKLVQPGSTNVTLKDGKDATPGSIFMRDSGESVNELRFALLRAKRINREFTNDQGELVKTVSIGVLGVNLLNFSPFILNVSIASFSNFGRLMKQLKDKKASFAWAYPVNVTSEKIEQMKDTGRGNQMVKYFILNFAVENKPFGEEEITLLGDAYKEFAGSLDRGQETEEPKTEEKGEDNSGVSTMNESSEEKEEVPF